MEYLKRFLQPPENHFFLMGPRGTGKTSWTQHRFDEALRIDLLDPGVFRANRPKGPLDAPEEIDGAALESLSRGLPGRPLPLALSYRGTEHFVRDNIRCMPCEAFLKALRPSEWPTSD